MTNVKWAQLIGSVVLILLPPAMHCLNWWFNEQKGKKHHRYTGVLLSLWFAVAIITSAFTIYETLSGLEHQREQAEWETGGTNVPLIEVSAPYVQTNLLVFEISNCGWDPAFNKGKIPIYNTQVTISHQNKQLLATGSKPSGLLKPLSPQVSAGPIPISIEEKEIFYPESLNVGTLNPVERRKICSIPASPSTAGGKIGTQYFIIQVVSLNAVMWGQLRCIPVEGGWAHKMDVYVTYADGKTPSRTLHTRSRNYPAGAE